MDTVVSTDRAPTGFNYSSVTIAPGVTLSATGSYPLIIRATTSVNIRDHGNSMKGKNMNLFDVLKALEVRGNIT
jgi:hypothetical protein